MTKFKSIETGGIIQFHQSINPSLFTASVRLHNYSSQSVLACQFSSNNKRYFSPKNYYLIQPNQIEYIKIFSSIINEESDRIFIRYSSDNSFMMNHDTKQLTDTKFTRKLFHVQLVENCRLRHHSILFSSQNFSEFNTNSNALAKKKKSKRSHRSKKSVRSKKSKKSKRSKKSTRARRRTKKLMDVPDKAIRSILGVVFDTLDLKPLIKLEKMLNGDFTLHTKNYMIFFAFLTFVVVIIVIIVQAYGNVPDYRNQHPYPPTLMDREYEYPRHFLKYNLFYDKSIYKISQISNNLQPNEQYTIRIYRRKFPSQFRNFIDIQFEQNALNFTRRFIDKQRWNRNNSNRLKINKNNNRKKSKKSKKKKRDELEYEIDPKLLDYLNQTRKKFLTDQRRNKREKKKKHKKHQKKKKVREFSDDKRGNYLATHSKGHILGYIIKFLTGINYVIACYWSRPITEFIHCKIIDILNFINAAFLRFMIENNKKISNCMSLLVFERLKSSDIFFTILHINNRSFTRTLFWDVRSTSSHYQFRMRRKPVPPNTQTSLHIFTKQIKVRNDRIILYYQWNHFNTILPKLMNQYGNRMELNVIVKENYLNQNISNNATSKIRKLMKRRKRPKNTIVNMILMEIEKLIVTPKVKKAARMTDRILSKTYLRTYELFKKLRWPITVLLVVIMVLMFFASIIIKAYQAKGMATISNFYPPTSLEHEFDYEYPRTVP
ncbi:hypothetical protein SNEBB_003981 [Seison nebaliae]|nr:hypothetical protein SNEBB_003981 [Seison nebaliae]